MVALGRRRLRTHAVHHARAVHATGTRIMRNGCDGPLPKRRLRRLPLLVDLDSDISLAGGRRPRTARDRCRRCLCASQVVHPRRVGDVLEEFDVHGRAGMWYAHISNASTGSLKLWVALVSSGRTARLSVAARVEPAVRHC